MASSEPHIILEKRDHIGYISFNRPEKLNAISGKDFYLLDDLVNECDRDPNIRAIILTGKGSAFTASDDIEEYPGGSNYEVAMAEDGSRKLMMEGKYLELFASGYHPPLQKTCLTLMNSGTVSIAAVNGICMLPEILYAIDFVIAADVATFMQADVSVGICPGGGGTQTLVRLLGRRRAIELILMAEQISAQEAYRIGLANKVVPLAKLMPEAEALAKKMMARSPEVIKLAKTAVTKAQGLSLEEGLDVENYHSLLSLSGEAFQTFTRTFHARQKAKGK